MFSAMLVGLFAGLVLLSCSSNGDPKATNSAKEASGKKPPFATTLLLKIKPESIKKAEIEVMESSPQQFALNFDLQTPMPGYSAKVGKLEKQGRTLRARVDLLPPEGPSLTVLDQASVRIPFGELRQGPWTLELKVFQDQKLTSTLSFHMEAK